eukprot:2311919-Rhodomonas_salina.1
MRHKPFNPQALHPPDSFSPQPASVPATSLAMPVLPLSILRRTDHRLPAEDVELGCRASTARKLAASI